MAYRVEWLPRAIEDLEAIAHYISADSSAYAAAVVKTILSTTRNLSRHPFAGRVVPALMKTFVSGLLSYRVIYRIENQVVTIATVVHGKRLSDVQSFRYLARSEHALGADSPVSL